MRQYQSIARHLEAVRLPYTPEVVVAGLRGHHLDPQAPEKGAQKACAAEAVELARARARRREEASRQAVADGFALWALRKYVPQVSWSAILRQAGISRRTANHLMALACFAQKYPALFQRFQSLGPTKLYRLAVTPEEVLGRMHLDQMVKVNGRAKALRSLTDVELGAYLRGRTTKPRRRPGQRILQAVTGVKQMIVNAQRRITPVEAGRILEELDHAKWEASKCTRRTG
jgi:hypothetical protein